MSLKRALSRDELLAAEEGTLRKDAPHRIALVYPSPYRAAMSSLGYQTIYRLINAMPEHAADRAMLPDDASAALSKRRGLQTLETGRPVGDYPLIAFSVAYELELAGLIDCLRLSGIPLLREDRDHRSPLVIAGGPLTFSNPAPLAAFCDLIIVGEGEDLAQELCRVAAECDYDRDEVCAHFSGRPGIYIPSTDGERIPSLAQAKQSSLPAFSQIITPNTELRSMFLTEVARGCSRGCSYCVMRRSTNHGMRAQDTAEILRCIPEHARRVGLVGAAVTDHPDITEMVRGIVDSGRELGISSLRADRLTDEFVALLAQGGYRTLTVAFDAPSQRMREGIDRPTREHHLLKCADLVRKHRLRTLKVYMIVGLPGEEEDDIDELIAFAHQLADKGRTAFGVAPFVAKRNTPLDGEPFAGIRLVERRLKRLRKGLKGRIDLRPTSARWAWVEYMLAQCESNAGLAVMDAHLKGGTFADYKRAFAERGCEPTGPRARVLSSQEIRQEKKRLLQIRIGKK